MPESTERAADLCGKHIRVKMDEIVPNLFVGDLDDALSGFDGTIICVLERKPLKEPAEALWIPFLEDGIDSLHRAADAIDVALVRGERVLVHCVGGRERAPLTVAWFLHRRRGMTLDEAYELLVSKRPIVEDRRHWIFPPK